VEISDDEIRVLRRKALEAIRRLQGKSAEPLPTAPDELYPGRDIYQGEYTIAARKRRARRAVIGGVA
jgi:hypothetical protein